METGEWALTVGFDLDMTLIDSRAAIGAVYDLLAAETGVSIDSALAVSRLGPPVEVELANWFPPDGVRAAADRYRLLYREHGASAVRLLPGAREAVAAVREHGGRIVVVTGKHGPNAELNLAAVDLRVDAVVGSVFGVEKGPVLREHGASVYVGDHLGDIAAARAGGALSVTVATGPYRPHELRDGGCDVSLGDLTQFPGWLGGHVAALRAAGERPAATAP